MESPQNEAVSLVNKVHKQWAYSDHNTWLQYISYKHPYSAHVHTVEPLSEPPLSEPLIIWTFQRPHYMNIIIIHMIVDLL